MKRLFILFLLFIAHCPLSIGYCQWPTTVEGALVVDNGIDPFLAIDSEDHSIIVVYNNTTQIRAKKYDKYGYPMWGGQTKVLVDTAIQCWAYPSIFQVISDDSGGAVVCWADFRHSTFDIDCTPWNFEVYLQRIDCNGNTRFETNGKQITTLGGVWFGDLKTDYHGGFVVAMTHDSAFNVGSVKRYDRSGNVLWKKYYSGSYMDLNATDAEGSSFISYGFSDAFHRMKFNIQGDELWPDTLIGRIPDSRGIESGAAESDGHGGVIGATWRSPGYEVYANRVDSAGMFVFGNGLTCGSGSIMNVVADGQGGIFLSFMNNSNRPKIQSVSIAGQLFFDSLGLSPCLDETCVGFAHIVSDEHEGIVVIYGINSPILTYKVQRINKQGSFLWDSTGMEFYKTSNDLFPYQAAHASDGRGGLLFMWTELYSGIELRMKQISVNGALGDTNVSALHHPNNKRTAFKLHANYPNPFNTSTTIRFSLRKPSHVLLHLYNVLGQEVRTVLNEFVMAGEHAISVDFSELSTGIYFCRIRTPDGTQSRKMLYIK